MSNTGLKPFVVNICILVLVAFMGVSLGLFLGQSAAIRFEPSVTMGQALQSIVLLLVFVLANHVYTKIHETRKKKVEILVDVINDVLIHVQNMHSAFRECIQDDTEDVSELARFRLDGALTNYGNAIHQLEGMFGHMVRIPVDPDLNALRRNREEYKDLITSYPYPTKLPKGRIAEEAKLYGEICLKLRLFQLQLT